jgi:hypothetical protein
MTPTPCYLCQFLSSLLFMDLTKIEKNSAQEQLQDGTGTKGDPM